MALQLSSLSHFCLHSCRVVPSFFILFLYSSCQFAEQYRDVCIDQPRMKRGVCKSQKQIAWLKSHHALPSLVQYLGTAVSSMLKILTPSPVPIYPWQLPLSLHFGPSQPSSHSATNQTWNPTKSQQNKQLSRQRRHSKHTPVASVCCAQVTKNKNPNAFMKSRCV